MKAAGSSAFYKDIDAEAQPEYYFLCFYSREGSQIFYFPMLKAFLLLPALFK